MAEDTSTTVSSRIVYFEPSNSTTDNNILYSYDEYNMAIDLTIEVHNRFSCGFGKETGEVEEFNYSTEKGTISFLGGSKDGSGNYLTANYTDISMTNPDKNTSECLGIESITINYDSWFYPQVNIKFVDVRGATVFQQSEKEYYGEGGYGGARAIYKSLFSFPYPIFTLRVKGFYGKGVTYKLAVSKTNMSFDSASGNFIITVDFIGYMYGIFADIPMTFLAIAPYTRKGIEYWQEKKSDGTFVFKSKTGEGCEMPTFPELRKRMFEALADEEVVKNRKTYEESMGSITEQYNALKDICDFQWPFDDSWKHFESESFGGKKTYNWYKVVTSRELAAGIGEKLLAYKQLVDKYDTDYKKNYSKLLELERNESLMYKTESGETTAVVVEDGKAKSKDITLKGGVSACYVLYRYLRDANPPHYEPFQMPQMNVAFNGETGISTTNFMDDFRYKMIGDYVGLEGKLITGGTNDLYVVIYAKSDTTLNDARNNIRNDLGELEKQAEKKDKECSEIENALLEKALGFKPTIKNIYELAFAHMDTFMHVFYSYMREIKNQLSDNRELRKKSHYGIGTDGWETDTEQEIAESGNENNSNNRMERSHYLPPFTSFYKNSNTDSYTDSDEQRVVLRWPGELSNSQDLVEVDFVKDFLESAGMYFKIAAEIEKKIENMSKDQNEKVGNLTTGVENFIPVTTYDMLHNDGDYNPYTYLKSKITDDSENIESDVIFTFLTRAYYFASKHNDSSECKSFGTIEAINFYKANGDNASGNFLNFIKNFAGQENIDLFAAQILTCANGGNCKNEKLKEAWKDIGTGNLFSVNAYTHESVGFAHDQPVNYSSVERFYKYGLYKPNDSIKNVIPVGESNPTNVKKHFAGIDDIENSGKYITISNTSGGSFSYDYTPGAFKVGETYNNGSFALIEDGKYSTNLAEHAKEEMEVSLGKLAQNEETLRNEKDNYGEVYRQDDVFDDYGDVVGKDGDAVYRKFTIVDMTGEHPSRDDLKTIVRDTEEVQQKYFIKYPSLYSGDKAIKQNREGYGVETENCSLFSEKFYTSQDDNIRLKAYLYLMSVPILSKENVSLGGNRSGIPKNNKDGTCMKSVLLREGAFYWYQQTGYYSIKIPEGYKKAEKNQWYCSSYVDDRTFATVNFLIENGGETYETWNEPTNCTDSRKEYLINYFINWANNEYKEIEPYLINPKYYNKYESDDGVYNPYGGGLNISCITQEQTEITQDAVKIQDFLRDLFFTECTVFDYENSPQTKYGVNENLLLSALNGFLNQLALIYGTTATELKESPGEFYAKLASMERDDPFKNDDLRLSTYMTLKSLYDKWLCAPYHGIETWSLSNKSTVEDVNQSVYNETPYFKSDFENFFYIDNYYHDISYDINVNISKVAEWIAKCLPATEAQTVEGVMGYFNKTLYEYMAEIAQDCGGMLLALPQRFGLMEGAGSDMFKPIPSCGDWVDDSSSFVFIYTYRPSERLGENNSNLDMNGWSPEGDGFDLLDSNVTGKIMGGRGYSIPAFGVTYAKQNQSFFKNITLNSEVQGTTEVGLRATFNIASKSSTQPRETLMYGQDLYKVFANYAYECTVEMLGDMQVFPLMYFQLNNIPLWRGAYMIKKVTHNITAGNISTTFTGIRQNRYAVPFANGNLTVMRDFDGQARNYGSSNGNFQPYAGEYNGVTRYAGTNKSAKLIQLFGTDEMTQSLAASHMKTIKVPGWDRNDLNKEVELSLTVHEDVAEDVLKCVTAIKEQTNFKIYSIGGYNYRVVKTPNKNPNGVGYADDPSGKLSNHSFGVAIDINPGANPFIYNSAIAANGTEDTDTRMRTNDSPVVKAFKAIGWGWGGNYGSYKDYMHFSAFDRIPKDPASGTTS